MRQNILLLALLAAPITMMACSTPQTSNDRYLSLDYDTKTVFLTYYPYLTREQRDALLTSEDKNPKAMIEEWGGQFNDPDHHVGSFDEMMNNPVNRKITLLEINLDSPEPILSGTSVEAHAIATYASGKKVDVTHDTEWKVEPHLGDMKANTLGFDCVNSDLTITASFLGEKESAKLIEIHKPLKSLEVKVAEAYVGKDSGYNFQLNLLAHCKDGTVSDVSCQATWSSFSDGGKVGGCGNFVVTSKEKLRADALTVVARYGDLSVRKTLRPPVR